MSRRAEPPAEPPSLALGFLVAAPLFACYELARLALGPGGGRNVAEILVLRPFELAGLATTPPRLVALALGLGLALAHVARREPEPLREARRMWAQGALAALAFGPLLVLFLATSDVHAADLAPRWSVPTGPRPSASLASVAGLLGSAAWEELVFRVGVYGLVYLVLARAALFFEAPAGLARAAAELVAMLGSSLAFASVHLAVVTRALGSGGEPFDPVVFLWRTLAGCLLAALFRWRGLGVAAWAHGLFNLAVALGAGPGVFLPRT